MASIIKADLWQNTAGVTIPSAIQYVAASSTGSVSLGTTVDNIWRDYLSITITPKFSNSKLLVQLYPAWELGAGNYPAIKIRTYRYINGVANNIQWNEYLLGYLANNQQHNIDNSAFQYLDTPNTTLPVTYYFQATNDTGSSISGTYAGRMSNYNSSEVFVWEIAQ